LAATGTHLTAANGLNYLLQQLDTILTGRWFGAATLGLYNRAGQLLVLPALHVATPLSQVMVATLARLGVSSPGFVRHLRETVNLTAHLTLPFAGLCLVLPEPVIRLVLGPDWLEATPLLRLLAVNAALGYLGASTYGLCIASGNSRRLTLMAVLALPVTAAGLWLGRGQGATGLAAGLTAVNGILFVPRLWWGCLGTPVHLRDYAAAWIWPLVVSVLWTGGLVGGRLFVTGTGPLLQLTGAGVAGGAAVLLGTVLLAPVRRELRHVWEQRPRRRDLDPTSHP
jgi:PST family polysaccharide transporter